MSARLGQLRYPISVATSSAVVYPWSHGLNVRRVDTATEALAGRRAR